MTRESPRMGRTDRRGSEAVLGSGSLQLHVLGGVEAIHVSTDGPPHQIDLGGRRQRTVLALLLARNGTPVHIDTVIDDLWGDEPPATARHTVQVYLSELRRRLPELIESTPTGYLCRVDASTIDSLRYEAIVGAADAVVLADPFRAVDLYIEAESLWHGDAYEGVEDRPRLATEARRLAELRLAALEARYRAQLALGHHARIVGDLATACENHPFREEFRALHMLALYRSGRQAEALRAFQQTRTVLGEELGIEPSPPLRRLEELILVQDPTLEAHDDIAHHNPYPGLPPFTEAAAGDFHGRDRLVDELIEVIGEGGLVGLIGPSGSGKTSVVRAGLVPRLTDGWRVAYTQVGTDPFGSTERALRALTTHPEVRAAPQDPLAAVAADARGDGKLLLVLDQFEELFTMVTAEPVRRQFLATLLEVAGLPAIAVLVCLRADFYDRPLAYPAFGRALTKSLITVMPLAPEELEDAAVLPARRMGVSFEQGVLAALFSDLAGQPSSLPLFAHTLSELYARRSGNLLTLDAYRALGGVRHALAHRAEAQFETLDPSQREAVRRLFLRLVTITESGPARRRLPTSDIDDLGVDLVAVQTGIEAFTGHRLLILDRHPATGLPVIDLAHEALLTEWDRLGRWIDEATDDIRSLGALDAALAEWATAGEDPAYLATGPKLDRLTGLAGSLGLTPLQHRFVAASVNARDEAVALRESQEREHSRLRRRLRLTGVAAAVAAALGLVIVLPEVFPDTPRYVVALARPSLFVDDPGIEAAVERADDELGVVAERRPYQLNLTAFDGDEIPEQLEELLATSPDHMFLDPSHIGWGYMEQAVRNHPDIRFTVIGPMFDIPAGVDRVYFALEQAGFIAGAAAASTSQTGVIAILGADFDTTSERWRAGFEAGAEAVAPGIEILATYVARPVEPNAAQALFESGADVLFTVPQFWVDSSLAAATVVSRDTGIHRWVIGGVADASLTVNDVMRPHLLTSAVLDMEVTYYDQIARYQQSPWQPGVTVVGLEHGSIRLGAGELSAGRRDQLASMFDRVAAGHIDVPGQPSRPLINALADHLVGLSGEVDGVEPGDDGRRRSAAPQEQPPPSQRLDFLEPWECSDRSCVHDAAFIDGSRMLRVWVAGVPFHVRHGFVNPTGQAFPADVDVALLITRRDGPAIAGEEFRRDTTYVFWSDYALVEPSDRCGPDYFTQEATRPCEVFVHDFPDGLPPGRYDLTALWLAPCSAWVALGIGSPCDEPDTVISRFESRANMPFYAPAELEPPVNRDVADIDPFEVID